MSLNIFTLLGPSSWLYIGPTSSGRPPTTSKSAWPNNSCASNKVVSVLIFQLTLLRTSFTRFLKIFISQGGQWETFLSRTPLKRLFLVKSKKKRYAKLWAYQKYFLKVSWSYFNWNWVETLWTPWQTNKHFPPLSHHKLAMCPAKEISISPKDFSYSFHTLWAI